uniref:Adaptor related protein complex 1 subunit sigma 3b n=1 Tax=Oncorhynchus kisutch TaxID=8019 RepID=A0A8C7N0T7_ONCKI
IASGVLSSPKVAYQKTKVASFFIFNNQNSNCITLLILSRSPSRSHSLYRFLSRYGRYASLYFCCGLDAEENELLALEVLHRYVELLDKYFGNVCELDIIFNFEKAYFILDEFLLGGEVQETSKQVVSRSIEASDMLQETMEEYMSKPAF